MPVCEIQAPCLGAPSVTDTEKDLLGSGTVGEVFRVRLGYDRVIPCNTVQGAGG